MVNLYQYLQAIQPKLDELKHQWKDLEDTTANKGEKLFDANRHILYEQSCDDIDGWINEIESQIITEDVGHDLTTVNLLVQKQNVSFHLIFLLTQYLLICLNSVCHECYYDNWYF